MKASELMFGLVMMVGIMAIMGAFFSNTFTINNVAVAPEYNDTINSLKDIQATSDLIETQKQTTLLETNTNATSSSIISDFLDIVGFWFEKGWLTIKLIPQSMNLAVNMFDNGLSSVSSVLGVAYNPIKFMVRMIITLGIIFFMLAVVIKWDV